MLRFVNYGLHEFCAQRTYLSTASVQLNFFVHWHSMDHFDLVITNGVCVTASDVSPYDIAIKDERVVLLAASGSLARTPATRVIDAEGGYVTVSIEVLILHCGHTSDKAT